ncbi:MAG: hypothetical protein DKT66_08945 [Candidatus Melainabacteria bacterium]|nr:MAG: hypothetical protein DKT66_08945 [Candidatus Melainabacteria bacterium]
MAYLDKKQKEALDAGLDAHIPFDLIRSCEQETAILHVLRWHAFQCSNALSENAELSVQRLDRLRDAVCFCMQWIYEVCKPSGQLPSQLTDPETLQIVYEVFDAAIRFSGVNDCMNLIWTDWRAVDLQGKTYTLSFEDERMKTLDLVDYLIGITDPPQPEPAEELLEALSKSANVSIKDTYEIEYDLDSDVVHRIRDEMMAPRIKWELDPTWDTGHYTFDEFRKFWLALSAYSMMHMTFCGWAEQQGPKWGDFSFPFNSAIPVMSRESWITHIAEWSDLDEKVVELIVSDLTLVPELLAPVAQAGQPKPKRSDVVFQPFVEIGGYLALAVGLVITSNPERNLWDLLSIIRNAEFSALSSNTEKRWLADIIPWLESKGLKVRRIKVDNGDIDCLVCDDSAKFALGVQAKHLMACDRIKAKDVQYIKKGQKQTREGVQWIRDNLQKSAQKCGLKEDVLKEFQIEPLVLTKTNMLTAYADTDVPILCERLLQDMMDKQHLSLRDCWLVAKHELYVPKELPMSESITHLKFGDVEFVVNNFRCEEGFDCLKHIRIDELQKHR